VSTAIHKIIDHQIRRWEMEAQARRGEPGRDPTAPPVIRPCITVARMLGAGGNEISRRVAAALNYQVLDKEIVEVLIREGRFREQILQSLDERDRSSLELWVEGLLRGRMLDKGDYMRTLIHVLGSIALHGHAVILGRGANFVLGSERALHARIVAPFANRVEEMKQRLGLSPEEADALIRRTDQERAAYVQGHFKRSIHDPLHSDLILNTGRIGVEGAVELIRRALEAKFGGNPQASL